jgi:hypothetical protein
MSEELKRVRVIQNGAILKDFTCKHINLFPSSVRFMDITPRLRTNEHRNINPRNSDGGIDAYYSGTYEQFIDINDRTAILMLHEQNIEIWINF